MVWRRRKSLSSSSSSNSISPGLAASVASQAVGTAFFAPSALGRTPLPPLLNSNTWYKILNTANGMALDVVNDGNQHRDGKMKMATNGNYSGQYWQLRPSTSSTGAYNLCTMWLGADKCLDVYGDDKTTPHLAIAGNYTGQQWHIQLDNDGSCMLTNDYCGTGLVLAADLHGSRVYMADAVSSHAGNWVLEPLKTITENGFGF